MKHNKLDYCEPNGKTKKNCRKVIKWKEQVKWERLKRELEDSNYVR